MRCCPRVCLPLVIVASLVSCSPSTNETSTGDSETDATDATVGSETSTTIGSASETSTTEGTTSSGDTTMTELGCYEYKGDIGPGYGSCDTTSNFVCDSPVICPEVKLCGDVFFSPLLCPNVDSIDLNAVGCVLQAFLDDVPATHTVTWNPGGQYNETIQFEVLGNGSVIERTYGSYDGNCAYSERWIRPNVAQHYQDCLLETEEDPIVACFMALVTDECVAEEASCG